MTLTETFVDSLRATFRGPLIGPDHPEYDESRAVWNAMINKRPALVARCTGVADVAAAVSFGREHDLPVAVRGGGHSAAGKGTCDDGIVIDLSLMKGMRIDPASRTIRAQGGVTWGDFDHETQAVGLATPGGVISTTGIAGLTLGGGFGWLTRHFGLSCDNLRSVDLVTASGDQLVCSADENADLFWALRGGGGNFGVATSLEYDLHPVGPLVLGGLIGWPLAQAAEILAFHREQTRGAPDELGISAAFVTAPPLPFVPESLQFQPTLAVILCWSGDIDEGREVIQPWLDLAPPIQLVDAMPYTVMQSIQDDLAPRGRHSYWKAGYLAELPDDAIAAVTDVAAKVPSPFSLAEIVLWGGAVARVGADDSAFGQRDGRFLFNAVSMWEDTTSSDANVAWARSFYEALQPFATEGVYVNFLSEEGDQRIVEAYGAEKFARLARIKAQYDPENLFRLNQNIPPAASPSARLSPHTGDATCSAGCESGRRSPHQRAGGATLSDTPVEQAPKRAGRGRRALVAILVIIGCVLAPLSVLALWTRNTVLDTDSYVSTVAPLAKNPKVIEAAATGVTNRVMEATDLESRLKQSLPPRAARAAPAMTAAIQNVVHEGAVKILSSDQFAKLWKEINRRAHTQVVAALTGNGRASKAVKLQNGAVILDLTPLADRVRARITSLGFDVNAKVPGRLVDPKLVLFQADWLASTQSGVDALQKFAWVLPLLSLLCFVGAIALSRRRRTVLRSGIGIAIAIAVLLTAINLGRIPYLGLFPRAIGREAGGAAYDQVLHSLKLMSRAVFVFGLLVTIGAWLAGPSRSAVRLRSLVTGRERSSEPGPFAVWVGQSKVGLRVAVIALGAIALVAVDQPTGWTVLLIAVLVLIVLAVIELIARPMRQVAAPKTG